jgi:hypothetical protein
MKTKTNGVLLLFLFGSLAGCVRQSDIDQIPGSSLQVPKNLDDLQATLDNMIVMRETPVLSEISADDFYIADTSVFGSVEMNAYVWNGELFDSRPVPDWNKPYEQVYYANSVLDHLGRVPIKDQERANQIKGSALFIRGYAFHNLALQFSNVYDEQTATAAPGIPLRLTSDPLAKIGRASVRQTYTQILNDVKEAVRWLPTEPDTDRKNRPSVPAAYALLARVYLSMSAFSDAKAYADSCLMLYSTLLDYSSLDTTGGMPFPSNNAEVLYQSNLQSGTRMLAPGSFYIDNALYGFYRDGDLRKELFFSLGPAGLPVSRFSYCSDSTHFSGLAVDEVLLIRAECKARLGDIDGAMKDLATLLGSRWKSGAYVPPAIRDADEALRLVLLERRKELVFRGLRWMDIRRFNLLGAGISLIRQFKQQRYTLPPGDNRYVLPIPPDVMASNKRMLQNPR